MNNKQLPPMYSLTQIGIATFLGSALAAGYMLASNYAALGQRATGIKVVWASVAIVILFSLLPINPFTQPQLAVALLVGQILFVLMIANKLQGGMLNSFKEMGGEYYPMIRAVAIGLIASFIFTIFLNLFVALFGPPAAAS